MRFNTTLDSADKTFQQLGNLECPDCGGKLLRGPRAGQHNQNLTCRSCLMKFWILIVDRRQTGFYEPIISDADFRKRVEILGWERIGKDDAGAAYYNPSYPTRNCDFCNEEYTGPAVYCCFACAIQDA